MSPPPTNIDGTDITGATIDGQDVQEITIDGQTVFTAGPVIDTGLYLDDFADNKLTSRDTYSETGLSPLSLQPDASNFSNPSRPEYTQTQGSPTAVNQVLELSDQDEAFAPLSEIDVTWEFDWQFQSTTTTGAAWFFPLAEQLSSRTFGRPRSSYQLQINDTQDRDFRLFKMDGNGDLTLLISGLWDGDTNQNTGKLTRDSNGNFELFYDGNSLGTATDTSFTNVQFTGFLNTLGIDIVFDNFRVF